jgi:hypothetical protein
VNACVETLFAVNAFVRPGLVRLAPFTTAPPELDPALATELEIRFIANSASV